MKKPDIYECPGTKENDAINYILFQNKDLHSFHSQTSEAIRMIIDLFGLEKWKKTSSLADDLLQKKNGKRIKRKKEPNGWALTHVTKVAATTVERLIRLLLDPQVEKINRPELAKKIFGAGVGAFLHDAIEDNEENKEIIAIRTECQNEISKLNPDKNFLEIFTIQKKIKKKSIKILSHLIRRANIFDQDNERESIILSAELPVYLTRIDPKEYFKSLDKKTYKKEQKLFKQKFFIESLLDILNTKSPIDAIIYFVAKTEDWLDKIYTKKAGGEGFIKAIEEKTKLETIFDLIRQKLHHHPCLSVFEYIMQDVIANDLYIERIADWYIQPRIIFNNTEQQPAQYNYLHSVA